jgi:hypothetical protein
MPNWCMNDIEISGPTDLITDIFEKSQDAGGLLQQLVPLAEDESIGVGDQLEAWGTKWDVDPENLELDVVNANTIRIVGTVDSAWGPPITALETFANANRDCSVDLKYWESGIGFVGQWSSVSMEDEYYEYNLEDRASIDDIPDTLLEHFSIEEEYQEYLEDFDYEDDD